MHPPFLREWGLGKCFLGLNRNKRSISVDASTDPGREIVHRLVKEADVYIMNMRPGTEARLGLDYETLSRVNPRLVYASITGFGHEGPESRLPAYDIVVQARSGVMSTNKLPDGTPIPIRRHVRRHIRLHDPLIRHYGRFVGASTDRQGTENRCLPAASGPGHADAATGVGGGRRVANGRGVAVGHVWQLPVLRRGLPGDSHPGRAAVPGALCHALDLPEAATDPRFGTFQSRIDNAADLGELIGGVFGTRPLDEWLPKLKQAGVPVEAVVTRDQTLQDVQALANGMFWEQDHPHVGKVKMVTPPFSLSSHPSEERPCRPVPLLGEHTDEVLTSLGYGSEDIAKLHGTDAVRGPQILSKAAAK